MRHIDEAKVYTHTQQADAVADELAVVGTFYEAAVDPSRWPDALAAMTRCLGARAAILSVSTGGEHGARFVASTWFEPGDVPVCKAAGPAREPLETAPGRIALDEEAVITRANTVELTAVELERSAWEAIGHGRVTRFGLAVGRQTKAAVWFFGPRERWLGPAQRARLTAWEPHLRRALAIQHRLGESASRDAAGAHALDRLALGVIVVDEELRPLLINRAAERLLKTSDRLALDSAAMHGVTAAAAARLRAAIQGAIDAAAAAGQMQRGGVRLERTHGSRPLEVIVVAFGRSAWVASHEPAALVFIADPERRAALSEELLRELYGMTPAEGKLVAALAAGRTLTATASALGISRNTAHCQLASVFAKTGTSSRAELLRLLHSGPAAIRCAADSAE